MPIDEYISAPVGEGLLLARRHAHRLFALNETARFVWERRVRNLTPAEMADELAEAYGIDADVARHDIDAVLRHWREEGLIESGRPTMVCSVGGCRFLLRLGPGDVQEALIPILANFAAENDDESALQRQATIEVTERDGKYLISTGEEAASLAASLDLAVETVQIAMFRHVFNATDWQLSMHSAAIGRAGGCVLIAGESGRGKTTLMAHMLRRGFDYVADDMVLITPPDLAVIPIAMPLVLKRGSWAALNGILPGLNEARVFRRVGRDVKYWTPPRAQIAQRPVSIRGIIFPRFAKTSPLTATRLNAFDAIQRIMKAPTRIGIPLAHQAVERLAALVQACPVYDVAYDDADAASQWAETLLAAG
jgi:hypothetical protein